MPKKKRLVDMDDRELVRELLPKEVVDEMDKAIEKTDKPKSDKKKSK